MSEQNIVKFYDYIAKDSKVRQKLTNKIKKISREDTAFNVITNIANKENFNFSVDELKSFVKKKSNALSAPEINSSELSNVAGGKKVQNKDLFKNKLS